MSHDDHGHGRPLAHAADVNGGPDPDRLLVVIPAYNEERSITDVVRSARRLGPPCDIVVIDDGSVDRTAELARQAGAVVISLPFNLGIGGAVQTGFLYARDNGYQLMAQVDGDGQHDPAALGRLIAALRSDATLAMVCGSRFVKGQPEPVYHAPLSRRIGIRLFAFALTHALQQPVTDPTSGFRLCNRRAIELFAEAYPHDYPEVESLHMLHVNGLRFAEVAVPMHNRMSGRSSINRTRSGYYMIKVSLALLVGLLSGPIDTTSVRPPA